MLAACQGQVNIGIAWGLLETMSKHIGRQQIWR